MFKNAVLLFDSIHGNFFLMTGKTFFDYDDRQNLLYITISLQWEAA